MTIAELLELDVPDTAETATVSVPVPADILWLLDEHPAELGLPSGASRRKLLAALLEKGARTAAAEWRQEARERYYSSLAVDEERAAVAAAVGNELAEDGIL